MDKDTVKYWRQLAKTAGVKLPRADSKITTAAQAAFLKKLGMSGWGEWTSISGEKRGEFIALNPKWTLLEWAGCTLESMSYIAGK